VIIFVYWLFEMVFKMTPELAEICGIHAGDVYLRKRGGKMELEIGGSLEERDYYDGYVVPFLNNLFDINIKAKRFSKGTYGLITFNKEVALRLFDLGFPFGKKSQSVEIPKKILQSKNKLFYASFLRGLFDTDGHLGFRKCYGKYNEFKVRRHHYPTIQIVTISEKLTQGIGLMLAHLGIKYFVYGYKPKKPNEKYTYRVIINGNKRLEGWMDLIGSKNSVKFSRYLVWKKFGFCPTNLTLEQRESILTGKMDIYSIGL